MLLADLSFGPSHCSGIGASRLVLPVFSRQFTGQLALLRYKLNYNLVIVRFLSKDTSDIDLFREVLSSEHRPPPPDSKLTATAYHEAGHAVIALSLGRAIQRVTVIANQRYLGACHLQKSRFKPTKDWLEDEILILYAGMVAESRVTGKLCPNGAAQDLRGVRRLALMRAGGDRQVERLERRLLDKTEYLLNDSVHWMAIEAIAKALMINLTISGRAARHHFELAQKLNEE